MIRRDSFKIIIFLTILSFSALGCGYEEVVHGLSEGQVNKIFSRLEKANIKSTRIKQSDGLWAIAVKSNRLSEAITNIDGTGFFENYSGVKSEDIDQFTPSIFDTKDRRDYYRNRITAKSLQQTLKVIPNIQDVRIHIFNFGRTSSGGFRFSVNEKAISSASAVVIIKEGKGNDYLRELKEKVKETISGATGIKSSEVNVWLHLSEGESLVHIGDELNKAMTHKIKIPDNVKKRPMKRELIDKYLFHFNLSSPLLLTLIAMVLIVGVIFGYKKVARFK